MQKLTDWLFAGETRWGMTMRAWMALALLAVITLGSGISSMPVMDRDEARYSQASIQMMETGDFVDIRFQENPRHVKPAGIYWMQVLSATPFGGPEADIWAFRIPSLLGSLIAVFGTAWLAARFFGPQAGLAAGLFLAAAIMMQVEARTAKTDAMLLATGVLAQIGLIFMLLRAEAGEKLKFVGWPLLFWAASGAAIMIKGPIITMVSALTIIGYFILKYYARYFWGLIAVATVLELLNLAGVTFLPGGIPALMGGLAGAFVFDLIRNADTRAVLAKFHWIKGLIALSVLALPWLIAINMVTDWGFLQESVGHALFGKVGEADDSHGGPFLYHTLLSPLVFFPGSALIGLALLAAWAGRGKPEIRFLTVWIILSWVVFEFVQTKLPHYVLPLYPAIAILAAIGMMQVGDLLKDAKSKAIYILFVVLALVSGVAAAAVPILGARELGNEDLTLPIIALASGLVTTAALLWFTLKPQLGRFLPVAGLAALQYALVFGFAVPAVDEAWPSDRVADVVAQLEGCEAYPAATAGYREPSNVFHLGTSVALTDGAGAAAHLLLHPECGIAVVDQAEREAFLTALDGLTLRELGQVDGMNLVKGDELAMEILTLETSSVSLPR